MLLADPGDRLLHVDDLGRATGRAGREPVVDRDADPALGGQVLHQRDALLVLLADGSRRRRAPGAAPARPPAAARRAGRCRGGCGGRASPKAMFALDPDRDRRLAERPERVDQRPPRRRQLGRGRQRVELLDVVGAERPRSARPRAVARPRRACRSGSRARRRWRRRARARRGRGASPVRWAAASAAVTREHVRRQLAGQPAREERRDADAGSRAPAGSRWRSGRR